MAEPLGISGILPSTDYDQGTASDSYISDPESSISEYDQKNREEVEGSVSKKDESPSSNSRILKSMHIHRTEVPTVEPTVIPTTFSSFRLSAAKVSSVCNHAPLCTSAVIHVWLQGILHLCFATCRHIISRYQGKI